MARSLRLEALEAKNLLSPGPVTPFGITLNSFGVLRIKGADWSDDIATVTVESGQVHAVLKHHVPGPDEFPQGFDLIDQDKFFPLAQVKSIAFYGLDGNDTFTNDTAIKSTAFGYAGDDVLVGGSAADLLIGGTGNDTLEGRRGSDDLRGGTGSDEYVFAPAGFGFGITLGSDKVTEAANADTDRLNFYDLTGGITLNLSSTATQTVKAGYLSLTLSDPLGIENVDGTPGADKVLGNDRPNQISTFGGNDTIYGYGGADGLWGSAGADELHGGNGNDALYGYDDPDKMFGDDGNDTLDGAGGSDKLDGGSGSDKLSGDVGNDSLTGGFGNDTMYSGAGDDVLTGGSGNDLLEAWTGNDQLDGGWGIDVLKGGADNDSLLGGFGADVLQGDDGDDLLDGGTGTDAMDGGAGFDKLFANMGNETLSHGEHVEITVPGGSAQNDSWSCGPNSASRLLRSYGINVSYAQLKVDAQNSNIISKYGLGTPPPSLQSIMKKYKSDVHLASNASFQSVLDRLGEGRPVVALLGWGEVDVPSPPESPWDFDLFDTAPETLHYVCLTGFDMSSSTIFYTDTNGAAKSMSFSSFQQKWNWPGDGLVYAGLSAMGVKKNTMLW
jgi:Peptidase_C39 like family/RTX calcium-binding nonapeptide repeat (4 copies)